VGEKTVQVEAEDAKSKLFVVRYLKWLPKLFNPLGVVVGVVPAGVDATSASNIVDIQHHLPAAFTPSLLQEVQVLQPLGQMLPPEVLQSRTDLTGVWSFTIGAPDTSRLSVAFSIDQLTDASYQVCWLFWTLLSTFN
jgi:exoribonuclease R